jgi:hypothetical protein
MGRVASFTVGSYTLSDVPAAFPHAATRSKQEGADGIIGNQLLRRFNLVFDYDADTIWIAPNEAFDHAF